MAGKADFTEEEWDQLRKGATGAGLLVSVSDRSFLDSFKEASSFAHYLVGSRDDDSQLVRELASEHGTGFGAIATPSEVESAADDACVPRSRRCTRRHPTRSRATARSSSSSRRLSARPRRAETRRRRPRSRGSRPRSRSNSVARLVRPRLPFRLRVGPHAFGDPVDVVEVRDHLDRVVDRRVA
jgi:hypothetical protein